MSTVKPISRGWQRWNCCKGSMHRRQRLPGLSDRGVVRHLPHMPRPQQRLNTLLLRLMPLMGADTAEGIDLTGISSKSPL